MEMRYHSKFVKRWGWFRYLYAQLMYQLSQRFGFQLVKLFSRSPLLVKVAPPNTRQVFMTPQTLAPYINDTFDMEADMVAEAFAKGDFCIGMYYEQEFFGYGWVSTIDTQHTPEIWIKFGPEFRYHYKAWTLPAYRGRHLRGSIGLVNQIDEQRGTKASIAFISTHNYPSLAATERSGDELLGYCAYINCRFFFWNCVSSGAKRAGFCFYRPDSGEQA